MLIDRIILDKTVSYLREGGGRGGREVPALPPSGISGYIHDNEMTYTPHNPDIVGCSSTGEIPHTGMALNKPKLK